MNNDKNGYAIILVLSIIIGLIVWLMINYTTQQEKSYEYALKQEINRSSECKVENDICFCKKDNEYIQVDYFYTTD